MKKEMRGSYDYQSTDDVLLISWNDNAVVTIASNFGYVVEQRCQDGHRQKRRRFQ